MAKELYDAGGSLPFSSVGSAHGELQRLRILGLAKSTGVKGKADRWQLTQKGIDYCEGRIATKHGSRGRILFHATWLASLPRTQ